ncbi:MAG: T9SS C-terminal target domain-containing protein [Marinilabiliales bacterium]|nr:MAG: T9SS C-terminal target domain-containing protein [Marinilabiliales bacterium]
MRKYIAYSFLIFGIFMFASTALFGREVPTSNLRSQEDKEPRLKSVAEGCLPGAASTELNINNVRTRINSGGDMWWDFVDAQYEIPYGSGSTSMFAGALWIGGTDVNGQLKLAAHRYRQIGNDYFPGPLTTDGTATISADQCVSYDKMNVIYRKDVDEFIAHWNNPSEYPDYTVPQYFYDYPAHGDPYTLLQSYYLAPFYDNNGDGFYDPDAGDYPYYDISNELCHADLPTLETEQGLVVGGILADQVLKGDQTIWWVFNDKGNVHTESSGKGIGLEIRAQAFAFSTNDEINNMTFYSFEIINRSTYTLQETYMSLWTDPDLGYSHDDYVGCDVLRGLGYAYNGDAFDEDGNGAIGYGDQPPAVGIDFFQGPYMDPDGIDNPAFLKYTDDSGAVVTENCNEAINGVNFGNDIVDDERFGMRRFVYHNNSGTVPWYMTDPDLAVEYYNFLRGYWKDNTRMLYGGNAHYSSGAYGPECDFMFPDETDPCDWGTGGIPPNGVRKWTEETAGNQPYDRRFMQSAGPFTLQPGALNYITVGLPWARATTGGPFASVELLRKVDDKCQRLFDNCFDVVDGPDAPDMTIQELDKELIIYLSNIAGNNVNELYEEIDPSIVSPDSLTGSARYDSVYRFEGYQIYQLKDATVTGADLHDADLARLVAQCDIENDISRIINYEYSEDLGAVIPVEEVDGENAGIVHSFRIIEDQFASGDKRLINNKKYHFLVVAYAFNEYEKYSQNPDYQIPGEASLYGQQMPYLAGRKNIEVYTGIPHIPSVENGGTVTNAEYGDGPKITRVEGQGNGGNVIDLTSASLEDIVENTILLTPTYDNGYGPIKVEVIDPLNVVNANYVLRFDTLDASLDTANWSLEVYDASMNLIGSYTSDRDISGLNQQIFLDLGISITIKQSLSPGETVHETNGFLEATIEYADSSNRWLAGVPDIDGTTAYNWIRSGSTEDEGTGFGDYLGIDPGQYYEKVLGGTWAPYRLVSAAEHNPVPTIVSNFMALNSIKNTASVDIVYTPDKSKWTRCPVLEACDDYLLTEGGVTKGSLRAGASVDKDGNTGTAEATYDGYATGMGWFPGYAVNTETGERLNIAFAEDSWLVGENGRDMILNPTSNYDALNQTLFGGKHFVYVFAHNGDGSNDCPAYDEGAWLHDMIEAGGQVNMRNVFKHVMWVSIPMLANNENWLDNEAHIRLRVIRPYKKNYSTYGSSTPLNQNYPMYTFSTSDLFTETDNLETAQSALDLINVVPNPYYAFNQYEENQLDNRVKFTNLPDECTISIYSIDGVMIRQFTKDDPTTTYLDWDLKNHAGIPIAGGLYLIHVNAPGIGERTIKWFGSLRPVDLNNF